MNKPVYSGLSILEISKTLMYEFWYDYAKPNYQYNAKLCYMDTDSFIIYTKTKHVDEDMIGLMKNELGRKVMTKFFGLRPTKYSYLIDDKKNT